VEQYLALIVVEGNRKECSAVVGLSPQQEP